MIQFMQLYDFLFWNLQLCAKEGIVLTRLKTKMFCFNAYLFLH